MEDTLKMTVRNRTFRKSVPHINRGESRTHQSFSNECNINTIMGKYMRTGELTHVSAQLATYGDFTQTNDYTSARLQILAAEQSFLELPSKIRSAMGNDPAKLLTFLADPKNKEKAVELGLIEPDYDALLLRDHPDNIHAKPAESNPKPEPKGSKPPEN